MSFFKNLFSSKKPNSIEVNDPSLKAIFTDEGFNERYEENSIDPDLLDGCLKMAESYFLEYSLDTKVISPVNHPLNLDHIVTEGIGFHQYCKRFNLGDDQIIGFLAFAFADFLINQFGFMLYNDKQPEFPLRGITLKYEKNGAMVMIYPMEYTLKVLNKERTFEDLYTKLNNQLPNLPSGNDIIDKLQTE